MPGRLGGGRDRHRFTPAEAALAVRHHGALYEPRRHPEVKDPAVVFDGVRWHLFGSGCGLASGLEILHATAPALAGPWHEEQHVALRGVDHVRHPCAPGVVVEGATFHLYLQHAFNALGGGIEHLVSTDGGATFFHADTAVSSDAGLGEAGVYDPEAAEIGGVRYLSYAAMSVVGQPDLYLARSRGGTWSGSWARLGPILSHEQVPRHNQRGVEGYEWGLEAPQLLALPGGGVLLTATCFVADRPRGHRQRLLLAVAAQATGPYVVLGTPLRPSGRGGAGENGHGDAILGPDGLLHLIYQDRAGEGRPWRILRATIEVAAVAAAASAAGGPTTGTVRANRGGAP